VDAESGEAKREARNDAPVIPSAARGIALVRVEGLFVV
jgi:hypothetical protein